MVAREKNTIHERHPCHAGRLFRWQRRRRSTEDVPRVEESIDTAREENEDLTREESQPGHALQLNQRENGTLQHRPERRHSNQEHRGPGHIRKADLAENITENTMVLDIYRTPWSWTYRNDPGRDTPRTPQRNDPGRDTPRTPRS